VRCRHVDRHGLAGEKRGRDRLFVDRMVGREPDFLALEEAVRVT
jgi:hypothetical protein